MELINATRMVAGYNMGLEPSGRELLVVVVKGTFVLPKAGEQVRLADEQLPLIMADTFTGDPGFSAPMHEIDFAPRKRACDVLLVGSAHAPTGKQVARMRAGIRVGILTGRVSESVRLRARELGVDDLAQDPDGYKLGAFRALIDKHGIDPRECAFVGDDFPDLALLRIVGLPVAVGNAVPEIIRECRVHLDAAGGSGAVREFCELLLKARGEWEAAWQGYVAERSEVPQTTRS